MRSLFRSPSRGREWPEPTNWGEVRAELLAHLQEHGPQKTEDIAKSFKGRRGTSVVYRGLKFLQTDGYIWRDTNRQPWKLGQKPPS